MNSEKVKEIKKWLIGEFECCQSEACDNILTYINELEIENIQHKKFIEAYKEENESLYDDIHKKGMKGLKRENKQLKNRVDELEDVIATSILCTNDKLKKFAERLKEKLEEYRLENEYFTEHEPNGNLWQMNSSHFFIEVTQDGALIDETLKEFMDER